MKMVRRNERLSPTEEHDYEGLVLADRGEGDYAVWFYSRMEGENYISEFNCFWGFYTKDLDEALAKFRAKSEMI